MVGGFANDGQGAVQLLNEYQASEAMGVNTMEDLAVVEKIMGESNE